MPSTIAVYSADADVAPKPYNDTSRLLVHDKSLPRPHGISILASVGSGAIDLRLPQTQQQQLSSAL